MLTSGTFLHDSISLCITLIGDAATQWDGRFFVRKHEIAALMSLHVNCIKQQCCLALPQKMTVNRVRVTKGDITVILEKREWLFNVFFILIDVFHSVTHLYFIFCCAVDPDYDYPF